MKLIFPLAFASLAALSCGNAASTATTDSGTEAPDASVQTEKPNTNYKPAFEGQTRIAAVKTSTAYETRVITDALQSPWGIAVLPDGRLLITEKKGNLRIVDPASGTVSDPIKGAGEVDDKGQGGLLGLALDPDFAANRMVYWVFSEKADKGNHTAVAKGKLADDERSIQNRQVIYRALPTYDGDKHYGGRIVFDKDGHLFVSTGERSDKETRPQAQDLKSALGKILRITREGKPAAGNPFAGKPDALPEIYSYGHRNVQGLAFHPETGVLWNNEFGPLGGDELNLIKAGANYGWPTITYGLEYSGEPVGNPPLQQKEGLEQPVYYWDPVLSPSGMTFYTGAHIPEWKNNLFLAGLNSYHIARLVIRDNKVVGEERILDQEKKQRFRDIAQGKDGALYAITDGGRLYKIDKK
ncbi:MAG: PQQ-dependent sugar dehydrogenase [Taibaiella sp.]|nr:PQQ-dependent sugar dehydrogenase [Taibaiella sp.]